jgi:hypothetical protein
MIKTISVDDVGTAGLREKRADLDRDLLAERFDTYGLRLVHQLGRLSRPAPTTPAP